MQTASDAKYRILALKQLPPLSATAARLLELLSNENLSLAELSRVIGQDPSVTARILGVANSAYFGQVTPIHSVEEAVIRVLGLNMVKSLAFSIAVSGVFDTTRCRGFKLESYWYDSLATALLAREVCRHLNSAQVPDLDSVYLAGLLFDIGILVLVHLFPEDYASVLRSLADAQRLERQEAEERVIGISSQQAGAWLTDRWHLPPVVVRVLAQSPQEDTRCQVAAVSLAADLVSKRSRPGIEIPGVPESLPGLSPETLLTIEEQCRLRDEELHNFAHAMIR